MAFPPSRIPSLAPPQRLCPCPCPCPWPAPRAPAGHGPRVGGRCIFQRLELVRENKSTRVAGGRPFPITRASRRRAREPSHVGSAASKSGFPRFVRGAYWSSSSSGGFASLFSWAACQTSAKGGGCGRSKSVASLDYNNPGAQWVNRTLRSKGEHPRIHIGETHVWGFPTDQTGRPPARAGRSLKEADRSWGEVA